MSDGNGHLRSFVERIERLDEEIAGLNGDKRDLYSEAKSSGFDPAALKTVVGIRRKQSRDPQLFEERESLVDLYLSTLGVPHTRAPARAATEAFGEYARAE
jgi:uncharacterized protein (UPF0335 family)